MRFEVEEVEEVEKVEEVEEVVEVEEVERGGGRQRRKWHKGQFGVAALDPASEFSPATGYRCRVFDLRKLGVPTIPVVGQVSHWQLNRPSPWHVHENCIECIYCAGGNSVYESDGKKFRLMPGMMFVSRPNEAHRQLECPKGLSTCYLHFRPTTHAFARWCSAEFGKKPRLFACRRTVPGLFGKIFALAESKRRDDELRFRLQTAAQSLLLAILDSACVSRGSPCPRVVREIAQEMERHPERAYPLDALVARSGLSKSSFVARFKAAYGCPPHAYLLSRRMETAKALLAKGECVGAIAVRLGFPTPSCLVRTFRKFAGMTPKSWAKGNKQKY